MQWSILILTGELAAKIFLVLSYQVRIDEGWNILTECPNMRYGLSGAGLVSLGDTLLLTGGVGRAGILKAINR